ncbi:M48 family metalloprotease [Vandammella animalimorsus]|uniref:Peptidase M48 n=1 Tax=Vandammella animalimorsus TaxID=2029117 RepID=A0A2A2ABL8_9BURK|nr:M48 family metalloprotease [Vandammella animalimorsus]PAT35161.1 peptidase M48 [Vandammella animalimorsus]
MNNTSPRAQARSAISPLLASSAPATWLHKRPGQVARALCLAAWLAGLGGLPAGQASAQALPSLGEADGFSVGDERRIGDQIARQLYRDPDYIDDPVLQEYVQDIWLALMQAARKKGALDDALGEQFAWRVLLGKDRSVNAFALPGGYFGLHLGLINAVDSRDELASVMAHELSHVSQRHIARLHAQNARQTPLLIASMVLGALAASKNPDAAQAVVAGGQALAMQNSLSFSRSMEQEADRIGLGLMVPAGFDPAGFIGMFDKLSQANRFNDNGAYPYLRTHPLTSQRQSDLQARLPQSQPRHARPATSMAHAMVVARSRVLSLGKVDFLRSAVQSAQPLARTTSPQHSPDEAGAAAADAGRLYAGALAAAQLRDADQAKALADALSARSAGDAAAHRLAQLLQLELALSLRDAAWARAALAGIDSRQRKRPELFLRTAYWAGAEQLSAAAEPSAAQASAELAELAGQWQGWLQEHPDDAGAWQQLARIWTAQQQPLRAIRAEAEAQAARLDYAAAIDRLKAGQHMVRQLGPQADHVDASILQSRLAAIEQLHKASEEALKRLK